MVVELEEGWRLVAAGIAKIRREIEADVEASIHPDDYMDPYVTAYSMSTQNAPHDYSPQLYERYKEDVDNYNRSTVSPLREMQGEILLRHLVERWRKHNRIFKIEGLVFQYLGRYYIPKKSLPTVKQVASTSFRKLVFNELQSSVTRAVIGMINDEREGKLIDRDLVKNVLDIYVEIGSGSLDTYQVDFEQEFCESTKNYYSTKAQTWILE